MVKIINIIDKKYVNQNAIDMSINDIVNYFNNQYTKEEVENYLINNKLQYRKMTHTERSIASSNRDLSFQRQQIPINHDYFKTWSRDMAYIFGLWCADGYMSSKNHNYHFSIKLHKNDKYLLQKILNVMQSKHNIYENKDNSCLFDIGSKTIVNDIVALGGKERKSLNLKFPQIPNEYLCDFTRGYFDGDGCISFNKTKNAYYASISGGSVQFLKEILNNIKKTDVTIRGGICKNNKNPNNFTYKIWFGKNDTIKLGEIVYKNCHELDLKLIRKYEKFYK